MKILLGFVVALCIIVSSGTLEERQQCTGLFCSDVKAIIMKYIILQFDFNQMYTEYLTKVTNCLCNATNTPCIGTTYNTCIRIAVGRKASCAFSLQLLIDFYIAKTKEADFNCFSKDGLIKYKNCICNGTLGQCPGTKHNACFRATFG